MSFPKAIWNKLCIWKGPTHFPYELQCCFATLLSPQRRREKLLQRLPAAKQIFSAQMLPNLQVKNMNSWINPFCWWDHCSGALETIAATSAAFQHKSLQIHHKDKPPGGPSAAPVPCHPCSLCHSHPCANTPPAEATPHSLLQGVTACQIKDVLLHQGEHSTATALHSCWWAEAGPRQRRNGLTVMTASCLSHFKTWHPLKEPLPLLPKVAAEAWNQRQSTHYSNVVRKFYSETWYKFVTQHWVHDSDAGAYAVTTETQECFGQLL